ncbi:hypothetical protein N7492_005727 [Penicillium capsulatum]|uniref:Uncharacterized protein n=1 Tax=Penicillium capsulatum TaxID=69766 RepID=A0A9W9IC12_9EURO|nr:hypothetical protein N7492_005727 [Penicillium capsulatum]KAJ6135175.1 hypothetical protein N7512_000335 [Penicillium capsulatum]
MVKRNIAIAIIIIILFLILAIAGFAIYAVQNHVSFFSKKREPDEESAAEGVAGVDDILPVIPSVGIASQRVFLVPPPCFYTTPSG